MTWDKVKPAKYYTTNAPTEIFDDVKKQHESRIKKNKLFQLILNDINSKQKNSTKKEISLLESERKLEREKNEETKVDIENIMRQEKGLPPLDSSKNISEALDDEKNEQIDVLLNEAAEILNDLIIPNKNIDIRTVQALKN